MGQRLVITVESNDVDIAKIYYHWSAYSDSALSEAKEVVDYIRDRNYSSERELQLDLIRFCERNGGGVDWADRDYIQSLFPEEVFLEGADRSYGLVSLSKENMREAQRWSEGDVAILLDEDRIRYEVYTAYESYDEYVEWMTETFGYELDELPKLDEIPQLSISPYLIDYDDIDLVLEEVSGRSVVQHDGFIYVLVH